MTNILANLAERSKVKAASFVTQNNCLSGSGGQRFFCCELGRKDRRTTGKISEKKNVDEDEARVEI